MKISFITTVFNEGKTIKKFLESLLTQSKLPDEIIIVDGDSTDNTLSVIPNLKSPIFHKRVKIIKKRGNRSVGRNEAIKQAKGDIIACSDAGCILDRDWLKNIVKHFKDKNTDVVAGYYKGSYNNLFQKSLIPYVLVMPDKINSKEFLPSSRSMAFKKAIWEEIGGFPEEFSNNEDYIFAKKLKKIGANIIFEKDAIVNWIPRSNFKEAFIMFYRFAFGDAEAHIFRPKVIALFARYCIGLSLLILSFIRSPFLIIILLLSLFLYLYWSILKNYRYVKNWKALYFLPLIQLISDFAVLSGTILGFLLSIKFNNFYNSLKSNKVFLLIALLYSVTMLSVLKWGIPNESHPFTYHMDEWHQSQSVRNLFKFGTPNVEGSAHGPIFHFLLSGIYLVPFIASKLINPFLINSSLVALQMQERLFEIFRLNTLLFGLTSIIVLFKISKSYLKINPYLTIILFISTPIWLSLSNYFKYDIALMFWILLSFLFIFKYSDKPSFSNFVFSAIFSSLALSTKISALPMVLFYIISFFLFTPKFGEKYLHLILGLIIFTGMFLIFGIPDIVFLHKGSYEEFLYSNLISGPTETYNFILGMHHWFFIIFKQYPTIFGHFLYYIFLLSFIYFLILLFKEIREGNWKKINRELFLFISFALFAFSLIPLKLGATGNRSLVLLPFIAIFSSMFIGKILKRFSNHWKRVLMMLIGICLLIQILEAYSWVLIKQSIDPRKSSSEWILDNIPKGTLIGIENIPVYQLLPDVVLKEYYSKENKPLTKNNFHYRVIDAKSKDLPKFVIITNEDFNKYLVSSPKKSLSRRLEKEKYAKVIEFKPDNKLYNLFGDEINFFISGLVPTAPISIYSKF